MIITNLDTLAGQIPMGIEDGKVVVYLGIAPTILRLCFTPDGVRQFADRIRYLAESIDPSRKDQG